MVIISFNSESLFLDNWGCKSEYHPNDVQILDVAREVAMSD